MADTLHLVGHHYKLRKADQTFVAANFLHNSLKSQGSWRQNPDVRSICLQNLGDNDIRLMLEIEDECSRKGTLLLGGIDMCNT